MTSNLNTSPGAATNELAASLRQAPKSRALPFIALYLGVILSPLALAFLLDRKGDDPLVYQFGLSASLVGLAALCAQFVLSARLERMERPFGQELLIKFHRVMGMFAAALLVAHPLLLVVGRSRWPLLLSLQQPLYVWIGRIAVLVLIWISLQAIFRAKWRLDYRKWKASHSNWSLLLLAGGLWHVWLAGGDSKQPAMKALWVLLGVVAAGAALWHRFGVAARLRRRPFVVQAVREEAKDVWTLELAPQHGAFIPAYLPGQYQYLTLQRSGERGEEHPYTLSSSPTQEGVLCSTIKASGDFTRTIGRTKPGDTVLVEAPFGRFSCLLYPEEQELVFLAGGIGITPMLSMMRFLRDTGSTQKVLLLYSNSTAEDIAFRDELRDMESGLSLETHLFLSKPPKDWTGESGRIDGATLHRLVGEGANRGFYICGPGAFISSMTSLLRESGVANERIHFESFSS